MVQIVWKKARKKPIIIEFREPIPTKGIGRDGTYEVVETLEGITYAVIGRDYVAKGIHGELYPINKKIFEECFDVIK